MITIKQEMTLKDFKKINNGEKWDISNNVIDVICEKRKEEEFEELLKEFYPNGTTIIQLNNFLRFDTGLIYKQLDITLSYKVIIYDIKYDVDSEKVKELDLPTSFVDVELKKIPYGEDTLILAIQEFIEDKTNFNVNDFKYSVMKEEYE